MKMTRWNSLFVLLSPDEGGAGGGAGIGNEGGGNAGGGDQGKPKPVEFTPEQQARMQEIINETYGKAFGKAQSDHAAQLKALQDEIAKLKGGKSGGKDEKGGDGKGYGEDDVKKLLDGVRGEYEPKLTAYQQQVEQLRNHQRTAAIVSAAAKAKAVDPEVVAKLIGPDVGFDDEQRLVVLDANGRPRLNHKAEPMSIEEYVTAVLNERPYLRQATNAGGAGSSTQGRPGTTKQDRPKNWAQAEAQLAQAFGQQ